MNKHNQKAYTYLIGWRNQDLWYYGVRWANRVPAEEDLWIKYFTSSKRINSLRDEFGEPDVIRIAKKFDSAAQARNHESRFIKRVNAIHEDRWINLHDPQGVFHNRGHSIETRLKIKDRMEKRWNNPQERQKISTAFKGRQLSVEQKSKISHSVSKWCESNSLACSERLSKGWETSRSSRIEGLSQYWNSSKSNRRRESLSKQWKGRVFSDETKEKIRQSKLGRKIPTVTCPHCDKSGSEIIMPRWHFDNCKKKP